MTTIAHSPDATGTRPVAPRVRLAALLRVETRKLADTRSGVALLVTALVLPALLAFVVMAGLAVADDAGGSLFGWALLLDIHRAVLGVIVAVMGVLAVTTEWSHRTALATFLVEPRRGRVLLAKVLAVAAVATAAYAAAIALSGIETWGASTGLRLPMNWTIDPRLVAIGLLIVLLSALQGLALGMLLMNAPAAIAAYFLIPIALTIGASLSPTMAAVTAWLDTSRAVAPLLGGAWDAVHWGHLAVSVGVWVVLPMALGTLRLLRRDVQ